MKAYLVREIETKEFYGFFCCLDKRALFWLIDEYTDPGEMEYVTVPGGGVYTKASSSPIPTPKEAMEETEAANELFDQWAAKLTQDGVEFTERWDLALMGESKKWTPVVAEEKDLKKAYGSLLAK